MLVACGGKTEIGSVVYVDGDGGGFDGALEDVRADAIADVVQPDTWVCPDAHGMPVVLATGLVGARQIASDGDFVYVPSGADGTIVKVSRCADQHIVLASGESNPRTLTLFDQRAYFSYATGIRSIGENGKSLLDVTTTSTSPPGRLATDPNYVYFSANGGAGPAYRVAQSGAPAMFVANLSGEIAVDDFWIYGRQLVSSGAVVVKAPKAGGTLVLALTGPTPSLSQPAAAIAIDATFVYFAAGDGLHRVSKSGLGHLLIAKLTNVADIVVDGSELVVADNDAVVRMGIDGTALKGLFATATAITAVTADAASTYWLDTGGNLFRLDK